MDRRPSRPPTTRSPASRPRSKGTSTRYRLVGGKGGAGKTTCAAALAVTAAARGERTLAISTDPAPSLGDALGVALSGTPRRVPLRVGRLHALEIAPRQALARWLDPRARALETIALRGTWLDEADVRLLLRQSLPGIDELAALLEILRHGRSGRYDTIVIDTAPTGHTLRMLAMPATLGAIAAVFDHMQAKHRMVVQALRGTRIEDDAERVILELRSDAEALGGLLRDGGTAEVSLVTLPETLSAEETMDAGRALIADGIPLARVVVNRITPPPPQRCAWCDARRRAERSALAPLAAGLASLARVAGSAPPLTVMVPEHRPEPRGVRALRRVAADLDRAAPLPRAARAPRTALASRAAALPARSAGAVSLQAPRLTMFGGKGGVGKTTCAAAEALAIARREPARRVLLVSTDPAHSLADVLGTALSDTPRRVPAAPRNLEARELDAARELQDIRSRYAASVDALFDRLADGSAFDASHDRQVMHDLLDLAPPGLDEMAAVLNLVGLLGGDSSAARYDIVVVDTAPTGHALRLLELPEVFQGWTKALMSILLKYQPVTGIGELGERLLRQSRGLGRLRAVLQNPTETAFVVVTRAAALPREETLRLLSSLRKLRVTVPAVVVNALGRGTCTRCRSIARAEGLETERLGNAVRRRFSRATVLGAPASAPPPAGPAALEAWRRRWRALA